MCPFLKGAVRRTGDFLCFTNKNPPLLRGPPPFIKEDKKNNLTNQFQL
ncbi:hypothetical protein IJL65_05435 [bacterium]|nr:hypothetical protein [bacterium]